MILRFVIYKNSESAKRIGDVPLNISTFVKIPEYGSEISSLKDFKTTTKCIEKLQKGIDRFAMWEFEISSALVEVDGDDTFSMYHGNNDCEDTITDVSCIEKNRSMTDKNYYAKPFEENLKTKISIDIGGGDSDLKVISQEKVDRFGNSLEKAIPLSLEDSPNQDEVDFLNDENNVDKEILESPDKDIHLDVFEDEILEKEKEIQKLKK